MTRTKLLIGISFAALATGTVGAQTTTDSNGNRAVRSCGTTTDTNVCAIEQTGFENSATISQRNGTGNSAFITQDGDDNTSSIDQNGSDNAAINTQDGDRHFSLATQTGDENFGRIDQGDGRNSATVRQTVVGGEAGEANANATTDFDNVSFVAQGTDFQDGTAAPQDAETVGTAGEAAQPTGGSTAGFGGRLNSVTVTQSGTNLYSSVLQAADVAGGTAASANSNRATVNQSGTGSSSTIEQRSTGNSATVLLQGGGLDADDDRSTGTSANTSRLTQTNTTVTNDATTGAPEAGDPSAADLEDLPTSGNTANIAVINQGNTSEVSQDGVLNDVRVSILNGGSGVSQAGAEDLNGDLITPGRAQGNSTTIEQVGIGNVVRVSTGGRTGGFGGSGNVSTVTQGTAATGGIEPAPAVLATNHSATVFQSGTLDTVTITQNDNDLGPDGDTQGGTVAGLTSGANVAQRTLDSSVSVTQSGTNFARVSQGGGSSGSNSVTVNQTDAGDEVVVTPGEDDGDIFTPPAEDSENTVARQNSIRVSQAGISNDVDVTQNAINASGTIFQAIGGRNNRASLTQGSGATDIGLTARISQGAFGGAVASNNLATVEQDGTSQSVTVVQLGSGTLIAADVDEGIGAEDRSNTVLVQQSGSDHTATARQEAGVGASTTGDFGGAGGDGRSAELTIIQTNGAATADEIDELGGNTATITQQGKGQRATINQNGRANTAGILQTAAATNAEASITQTGNSNTFFITQTQANQVLNVIQTGDSNSSTNVVGTGPNGGGVTSTTSQPSGS